jgi:hypothetical protein
MMKKRRSDYTVTLWPVATAELQVTATESVVLGTLKTDGQVSR